jgi:signal transduction histidine kinase
MRNAIQATGDDDDITVSLSQLDSMAVLKVRDTGSGIQAEHLRKIWQPFFSTKGEEGTGLGLDICKRIVEGHHGNISCESQPGKGTTFTIELPIEEAASA